MWNPKKHIVIGKTLLTGLFAFWLLLLPAGLYALQTSVCAEIQQNEAKATGEEEGGETSDKQLIVDVYQANFHQAHSFHFQPLLFSEELPVFDFENSAAKAVLRHEKFGGNYFEALFRHIISANAP
ncbi:MAG: hypothetical protein MI784_03350 [Cytophagales bacterium]|nr:hypothetical protein [Cytophagales bacterium]